MMVNKEKKKKYGFTLTELLAVIVVLAIIFSITIIFSGGIIGDVTKNIDDATKKIILNAANEYVIEFRKTNDKWKENVDENGEISFCVSLQSLIDKGYYDDKDEYVSKNKDKILVSVRMDTSKVLDFNLVENNDENINNYCIYNKSNSDLDNRVGDITIRDDSDKENIGKLSYKVDKIDGKNYDVDINFSTTLSIETVERTVPVYVVIVLDNSGSMSGTAWNNARTAAISLSNTIISNLDDANIAFNNYDKNYVSVFKEYSYDKDKFYLDYYYMKIEYDDNKDNNICLYNLDNFLISEVLYDDFFDEDGDIIDIDKYVDYLDVVRYEFNYNYKSKMFELNKIIRIEN